MRRQNRFFKFWVYFQKQKGGEWGIESVWANCETEAKIEFRKKTGMDLDDDIYDYCIDFFAIDHSSSKLRHFSPIKGSHPSLL